MQITGLAAGHEYLHFFFNPVGCICRLYSRHGPVMALAHVALKQPRYLLIFAIGPEFNRGPFDVPQETRVVASHYLTHHLPDLYPEPERFRPERWRDINPTQYEYLPFNAGPRICIGAAFAPQVLKILLAMILQRFRFTVVPGTRIYRIVAISMNPCHGLPMIIAKKDRKYSVSEVRGQIREMVNFPRTDLVNQRCH
jgi:Cytochrome P450